MNPDGQIYADLTNDAPEEDLKRYREAYDKLIDEKEQQLAAFRARLKVLEGEHGHR